MTSFAQELKFLDAIIYGSATILLVLALAPLVRRWLGAQAAHALWFIVLLRLLVPWSPPWDTPRLPIEIPTWEARGGPLAGAHISVSVNDIFTPNAPSIPQPIKSFDWLLMIWAGGALALISFLLLRAARAARLVRRATNITQDALIQHTLIKIGATSRKLRICETRELQSPALCGLFQPTILLPVGWSDQISVTELRYILSHEYGHLRRGDLWWKWAFQLATALHWFNPLVWLAERVSRAHQEMACDEWVLSHQPHANISQYGETLLATSRRLTRSAVTSPVHAGMAETKAGLTGRIKQIARFRPHGWRALLTAFILAATLWLSFGPSRTNAEPPVTNAPIFEIASKPSPLPTSLPKPKYTQVEIEAKFVTLPADLATEILGPDRRPILSNDEYEKVIRSLSQVKGCDLLSTPRVTVKSGQKAVVKIVREFPYPTSYSPEHNKSGTIVPSEFETRNLGITIEVAASIMPNDEITCILNPQVVDFLGFVNYGAGYPARTDSSEDALSAALHSSGQSAQVINQPIFETRSVSTTAVLQSGQTVVLGDMGGREGQIMDSLESSVTAIRNRTNPTKKDPSSEAKTERLALYAFITARVIDNEGNPQATLVPNGPPASPNPTTPVIDIKTGLAYGIPASGKPGYAISPYAPEAGFVDLRGFPSGAEVKCPYTGRLFLVP